MRTFNVAIEIAVAALIVALLPIERVGAASVTIASTDAIWNYGGTSVAGSGSTTPVEIAITPGSGQVLTFSSVTGAVSLTATAYGPDGHAPGCPPGACSIDVSAAAGLSGIISDRIAFLGGVFLNGHEADLGHVTPATLDFTSFNFSSLTPAIDQVFYIGDGLTGTDSGPLQQFIVPSDATFLVLGIADANGYSGPPGAYFDNSGSFSATLRIASAAAPLPGALSLFASSVGVMSLLARRRRRKPQPS